MWCLSVPLMPPVYPSLGGIHTDSPSLSFPLSFYLSKWNVWQINLIICIVKCVVFKCVACFLSLSYYAFNLSVRLYICMGGILIGGRIFTINCDWNIDNVTFSMYSLRLLILLSQRAACASLRDSATCQWSWDKGHKRNNFEYITVFILLYFYRILIMPMFHRIHIVFNTLTSI